MDRSTKERLTGAIVLVAVAWLVIPVFLDGPEETGETVRQSVDLPGQEGQPTRTRRIVLDPPPGSGGRITDPPPATRKLPAPAGAAGEDAPADASEDAGEVAAAEMQSEEPAAAQPEPESESEPEPEPEARPEPKPEPKPEPEPASEPQPEAESAPAPQPAAAGSLWAVQLGSFSNEENAESLAADLRDQGFAAFLSRVQSDGRTLHRVRVGPQGSREEADKVAAALAKAGHRGQVVTHP